MFRAFSSQRPVIAFVWFFGALSLLVACGDDGSSATTTEDTISELPPSIDDGSVVAGDVSPQGATRACRQPGLPRCTPTGDAVIVCDDEGLIEIRSVCANGCSSGRCLSACRDEGVTFCREDEVRRCMEDGQTEAVRTCGRNVCTAGRCITPFCSAGTRCTDEGAVEICRGDGAYQVQLHCAAEEQCEDGRCVDRGINACGGAEPLEARPGAFCGPCGDDVWECDGPDSVVCSGATTNACGGCRELAGEPGEECGRCGHWECAEPDRVRCRDPGLNACNGCGPLLGSPGEPCGPCGEDRLVCEEGTAVCNGQTDNGCGGCEPLVGAPPGQSCGDCGTGSRVCEDEGRTFCVERSDCRIKQLSLGRAHTCIHRGNDVLSCWGRNIAGQTGAGRVSDVERVPQVLVGHTLRAAGVAAGGDFTCGSFLGPPLATLRCMGANERGQLATGDRRTQLTPTVDVTSRILHLSAGERHVCFTRSRGLMFCHGANERGQLGMGDREDRISHEVPRPVEEVLPVTEQIAAGMAHTCAINSFGDLWCWGAGERGQTGSTTFEDADTPIAVDPGGAVIEIVAGERHTCALLSSGNVSCWGDNSFGQLGREDVERAHEPATIALPRTVVRIAAGGHSTCAVLNNGELWCWGDNRFGQLGDGTRTSRHEPAPVSTLRSVRLTDLGARHACATRQDGVLWCWGDNSEGQLTGTAPSRLRPWKVARQ